MHFSLSKTSTGHPLDVPGVVAAAALAGAFAAALVYSRAIYAPCDDTYIYLVYVKNLLAGNGLTFNGMKVQGFTSVGWTALIALFSWLPLSLPHLANTLSAVSGLAVMVVAYIVATRMGLPRWRALAVPAMLAATWDFAFYMGDGLETLFFGATLLWTLSYAVRDQLRSRSLPAALATMILARPEGILIAALMIAYYAWQLRSIRAAAICAAWTAAILLPVIMGLRLYYGAWLPNTYHAKAGAGLSNVHWGVTYVRNFAMGQWLVLGLFVSAVLWRARRLIGRDVLFLAVIVALVADTLTRGGDNMVGARALLPVLPVIYLLIASAYRKVPAALYAGGVAIAITFCLLNYNVASVYGGTWGVSVQTQAENWRQWYAVRKDFALYLRDTLPDDAVVALTAAGVIPYYTDFTTIDMLGLNNAHIAKHGRRDRTLGYGHQAGDGDYVMSLKPDVIFMGGAGERQGTFFVSDREVLANTEFKDHYHRKFIGHFRNAELYAYFREP